MSNTAIEGSRWIRGSIGIAAAVLASSAIGCTSAHTRYTPQVVARGELTLRYDGERFKVPKSLLQRAAEVLE